MTITSIFLDDGGVMNDNALRGPQWRGFVAEYLVPRFGGGHSSWEAANTEVINRQMPMYIAGTGFPLKGGYRKARRRMEISWLRDMCEIVGVDAPGDDEECYRVSRATTEYVIERVRADYPGATEAIQTLHENGYKLYTASGTDSHDLQAFLEGMGVRELFTQTYGPDLIDTHKGSRHYYEGIMADADVSPDNVLVVDDSPKSVVWAEEAGATAVLVSNEATKASDHVIGSLAELPGLLAALGSA